MEIIEFTPSNALALDTFKASVWPEGDREHYGESQPKFLNKTITLLAKENDEIVGYATLVIDSGVAQLEPLMVAVDKKGQGIGTRLLKDVEFRAREAGVHKLWLETGADWKAREFYEKHGYIVRTILPNHIGNQEFVLMDKMI